LFVAASKYFYRASSRNNLWIVARTSASGGWSVVEKSVAILEPEARRVCQSRHSIAKT
jgi:hypothetical protein